MHPRSPLSPLPPLPRLSPFSHANRLPSPSSLPPLLLALVRLPKYSPDEQVNFVDFSKSPDVSALQADEMSSYIAQDTAFRGYQGEVSPCLLSVC